VQAVDAEFELRAEFEEHIRGRVLAVGGIKEKVIAAHRAGIKQLIMPKENEKDFPDIPPEVRKDIRFTLAEHVSDALRIAFPPAEQKTA